MKDDLLILRLLKIPVIVIKYLSKALAILTYLPNYLLILVLDAIIFNQKFINTLFLYCVTWPIRLFALFGVLGIFSVQLYAIYDLLSISHLHWGFQLLLNFIAFQAMLALMRHGYLTMITKFSPKKLKSPNQHLEQAWFMLVDILGLALTLINIILIVNIFNIFKYNFNSNSRYQYLIHIGRLIRKSILDIIKLFYIKIFFSLFSWRYNNCIEDVNKQSDNILQLTVLLTLLYLQTMVDLLFFIVFGFYSAVIHPRRQVYKIKIKNSYQKYKVTGIFVLNTLIQILECIILIICIPFKFNYSKQVLKLILAKQNDYEFHYFQQTSFVLKLALIKIPSLVCELILLIFYYKYKKIAYLDKLKSSNKAHAQQKMPLFKNKYDKAAPNEQQQTKTKIIKNYLKNLNEIRHSQREYLVFKCFGSLMQQIWFFGFIPVCTILKIWNISWLRFLVDQKNDLRVYLIMNYFYKTAEDYINFVPTFITSIMLGFYDPLTLKQICKQIYLKRLQLKKKIPISNNGSIAHQQFEFYNNCSAVTAKLLNKSFQQIKKDILFLPLYIACRLSLVSSMDCQHPSDSVELLEYIWMLFYMKKVQKSAYFNQYLGYFKTDEAAGMIKTQREKLRFWKFANKSIRHRLISKFLCFLLPKKRAEKAIVNAKIQKNFSAIANHYWHCYYITFSLLQYLFFFMIEIIVTLFGIVILLPLTLWRMPTFLILFKTHQFQKKLFFKILFAMYQQMVRDIFTLFIRIFAFIMFPRAYIIFCYKTSFRYTKQGIEQFKRIQDTKIEYIIKNIIVQGINMYVTISKILFVKILWVRKRDMNVQFDIQNIRLSKYFINFMFTPQYIPTLGQLKVQKGGFSLQKQNQDPQLNQQKLIYEENQKKLSVLGLKIIKIVDISFQLAIQDLPYLLLMVFLLFTLPWRFYYLKKVLFQMRQDKNLKKYFIKFLGNITKDYLCIMFYVILLCTIVKTKRAIRLFYRNFKLNFYIGTLKYSHLKQLQLEIREAVYFYYSVLLIILSCIFGPYRILQIFQSVYNLYKKYHEEKEQQQKNKKMFENTIKQGKSLQLITTIGQNSLLHVFRFLDTRELTNMTKVSKYMYDTIKQRDQVWSQHWQRVYASKYQIFSIKNDVGQLSYNSMCVEMFKNQNVGKINNSRDRFYLIALRQFKLSTVQTQLDLKAQLLKFLSPTASQKIFNSLQWHQNDGYGPQQNWPRPDDNEQFIQLMNIERRPIVELNQQNAIISWLFERPVQFFIIKLNHFYGVDSHRRKKQIIYFICNCLTPLAFFGLVILAWSEIWQITIYIGYKLLAVVYLFFFCFFFVIRYKSQSTTWVALHPFDIADDIAYYYRVTIAWTKQKSIKVGNFLKQKFKNYIVRPIRWISNKIYSFFRWLYRKVKHSTQLFVEKVAKPLYISISKKIQVLWLIIKNLYFAFIKSVIKLLNFIGKILKNIYNFLFRIVKSINRLYSNTLEYSLRLSLKYGTLGQLIFTIVAITWMISPSLLCYFYYYQRWFVIFSTLMTLVLIVTGYKHLTKMKQKLLKNN